MDILDFSEIVLDGDELALLMELRMHPKTKEECGYVLDPLLALSLVVVFRSREFTPEGEQFSRELVTYSDAGARYLLYLDRKESEKKTALIWNVLIVTISLLTLAATVLFGILALLR